MPGHNYNDKIAWPLKGVKCGRLSIGGFSGGDPLSLPNGECRMIQQLPERWRICEPSFSFFVSFCSDRQMVPINTDFWRA
jgi:hypothetical protein